MAFYPILFVLNFTLSHFISGAGEDYPVILGQYFLYADFLLYRILISAIGIDRQVLKFHFKYKALTEHT